jgi:signal transduction histidine kinase/DNA-binding response OmpR family regulator
LVLNNNELYVFYEDLPFNTNIPPVFLTRLLVNGQDYNKILKDKINISTTIKVDLPFRLNTITIEFAALNYLNPELNRYRYFMTKRDKDTLFVPQGSAAEYKRLPPGRYKFWVTGSNNDGIWNPSGVTLDIRILPPWYRSIVAYLLFTLSVLLTIGAYIRIRTRNLRLDKIKLEAEVKARTSELQEANRQLADVDRIKTNFFTSISHEIRTPLSLILGPLEHVSKDETLDKNMSGMIEIMKRNALRMMNLINQLLDISRLDAGKMKITLVEDDIVKCMRILVFEFLSYAESKVIRYITDLPKRPYKTWFDRDKIEKITSNLLSNAFRFTQKNGTVQCFVSIESDKRNNSGTSLHIRVTDTGKGIGREHQKRIFDRFYRVDEQHERNGYGTGIGLALVREFVSLLHGEIKVESIQGKGSEFSVVIPLGKDHLSEEEFIIIQPASLTADHEFNFLADRSYETVYNKKDEKNKIMMLLIEDNADLRMFIRESLSDDYVILEADNGKSGINMAFTRMPDIVITDIMMTDLDGISLCDQLKNDERTSHIPIIILTAKATSEDRIKGLKSGADDYIIKPFNMAELNTRIANLLTIRDKLKLKYSKFYSLESGKGISGSVDDKFMGKVIRIININLHNYTFDVAALVDQLGMSRSHFSRKLTVLTGLPPGTLIKNIRLEKAAELLLAKKGNIAQIANSVGMTNPSSFTKAFRKYFGVSPKEYAKH